MTSKEKIAMIKRLSKSDALNIYCKNCLKEVLKDLEEKELLESELKLEKHKVKYVMEQLKKQDEILEILKNNLEVYDTEIVGEDGDDYFSIRLNTLSEYEFKIIEEWLNNDK